MNSDQRVDYLCPKCMGVLEAGRVSFYTTDGLDMYWKVGDPPTGFMASWFDRRPREMLRITGAFGDGERQGYRCRACKLVIFDYE